MKSDYKKVVARNKKAYVDFHILETIEAGIALTGSEIKSIRHGKINLKGSYVRIENGGALTEGIHISPYKYSHEQSYDPTRRRKLLLHKKQIVNLDRVQNEKGVTIIPLEVYLKKGLAKVLIATARGKKKYDHRAQLRKKAHELEIKRALKRY